MIPVGPHEEQTSAFVTNHYTALKLMAHAGRRLISILQEGHFQVCLTFACIILYIHDHSNEVSVTSVSAYFSWCY